VSYGIFCHLVIQRSSDSLQQFVLQVEQAAGFVREAIGPEVGTAFGVDQLCIHLDRQTGALYAPFKGIADLELPADLARVRRLALVHERRSGGDHPGAPQPGKLGGQVVSDCVGQIIIGRVPVDVLERQHDDRIGPRNNLMRLAKYQHRGDRGDCYRPKAGPCRQSAPLRDKPCKGVTRIRSLATSYTWTAYGMFFYTAGPAVREEKVGLSAHLVVDALADAYRSRQRQGLKPSRDIDVISVNVR
jgi:hypothetical protein